MRLIDADALELEGWYLSRHYIVDSKTGCFESKAIKEVPTAQPEIIRCHQCGFWDRETLQHNFNDFRDWNEAECLVLAERDGYHEINRYTEADDFCSRAERREE